MSWYERFKARLKFLVVGMAIFCPGFLIWTAADTKRQIDSNSWPTTPGMIVLTKALTWHDAKRVPKYYGRVVYRYTVDGREYTSELTDLGPGEKRATVGEAMDDVKAYHAGEPVTVYYDPDDPSVGLVANGIPQGQQVVLIACALGSVVCGVGAVFVVRSWLRAWRSGDPAAQPADA